MPYSPEPPLLPRPRPVRRVSAFSPRGICHWRCQSVVRGTAVVLASVVLAFRLARFPHNYFTLWLLLPLVTALAGTADTLRCMQPRWNWYHGGVLLCVYMDLMAVCMILFFLLYPLWL